jgi:negative regulator of flagellin synthesis FlgM
MSNEIKLSTATPVLGNRTPVKSVTPDGTPAQSGSVPAGDRVSMTDTASRLQKIEEQLSAMPDINHDKVAEIKKAIADGTFSLDPKAIADKLIDFETSFIK